MAVKQIEKKSLLEPERFIGLSTDTKPTTDLSGVLLRPGCIFEELGTNNQYIFDGSVWQEYIMRYKDLGLVIDSALTAGSIIYSNFFDNLEWVRNMLTLEQSDQQYDVAYFRKDFNGNVDTGGATVASAQSAFTSPNWRPHAVGNIMGFSVKFYLKNSSVSNNTYTRLRVQLLALN